MANVKITELTADTNPASTDVLPFVDIGADETKKVTIADLLENAGEEMPAPLDSGLMDAGPGCTDRKLLWPLRLVERAGCLSTAQAMLVRRGTGTEQLLVRQSSNNAQQGRSTLFRK